MGYNKGDNIKVQISNITDIGAFVKLEGRASGMIHYSEVPCKFGQVSNYLAIGQEIEVVVLGPGKPDKYGNPRYNLSKKKIDEQAIREQVALDIDNLGGEEKSIREIWKIFTQINKCLLQYMKQPILLDANSARLNQADGKLVVKLNTESKFELFQKSFKQRFNTDLIPIGKDSWNFYANIDTIPSGSLKAFEEECECLYMNFFPQPYVEGRIWNYKKEHRENIESQLEDCFPNIVVVSNKKGELSFRQAYSSHSQARDFFIALRDILTEIKEGCTVEDEETGEEKEYEPIPFDFEIFPLEEQDKFLIERNVFGQQEHEAVVIGTLRGETFSCDSIEVGKLKNVNYPSLTFIIDKDNITAVDKLVSDKKLSKVSTDLTGDSEKVNRLQESFDFITENFSGVEITMQVDTLVEENSMMKMLRIVIESMGLPEEEIYDSDGYLFSYSKNTAQTLDKLLDAGFGNVAGIVILAQTVELGYNLGSDIKEHQKISSNRQTVIAEDIYRCLTEDFGTKYTAAEFAKKYRVSDTTVKKYFKKTYGYGFKEYQTKVRMEYAAKQLKETDISIGEIANLVGYSKQTKFTKAFKAYYDVTPSEYRKRAIL